MRVVTASVAGGALAGVAEGRLRDEAAGVDGPEGDAGTDGVVDGGVELGLVVDAVEGEAAGEVDEDLFLAEAAEHLGGGLKGGELAVGVEEVELAAVLT